MTYHTIIMHLLYEDAKTDSETARNAQAGPSGAGIVDWSRCSSLVSLICRKMTYSSHTSQPMMSTAQIETRPPSFVASLTSPGTLQKCASRTRTMRAPTLAALRASSSEDPRRRATSLSTRSVSRSRPGVSLSAEAGSVGPRQVMRRGRRQRGVASSVVAWRVAMDSASGKEDVLLHQGGVESTTTAIFPISTTNIHSEKTAPWHQEQYVDLPRRRF